MRLRHVTAITVTIAALGAGCGASVSKSEFRETLVNGEAKLSEQVADCVTEELFRNLDDAQIENVYTGERADLTPQEISAVSDAAVLCASGAPGRDPGAGTGGDTTGN